jgi:predicted TIM-barrel fold metal-dependent hydrolase
MLTDDMELISVDDHIIEPRDVWTKRLPSKWNASMPRVVEQPGGGELWVFEGRVAFQIGLNAVAGRPLDKRTADPARFDQMRPGCYDPVARLADMNIDRVEVELCFPSFPGFGGRRFIEAKDKELGVACVRAYNDFVLDEWCAADPWRFIPLIIIPLWDPEAAVREIHRCAARGARSVAFPENPGLLGLPSFQDAHWSGVFAAAAEAQMPLSLHFGGSGVMPPMSADASIPARCAVFGSTMFNVLSELVFSPVLHDHPALQFVFSESGIGWVPFAHQRLEQVWHTFRSFDGTGAMAPAARNQPPHEVLDGRVLYCFIDDPLGVQLRDSIGVHNLLWESDYPHADGIWPDSRTKIKEVLADVPDSEARMIVEQNARRVFRFPAKPEPVGRPAAAADEGGR